MIIPAAIFYLLDTGLSGKLLYLLKGDENVLFILDEKFKPLTGTLVIPSTVSTKYYSIQDIEYKLTKVKAIKPSETMAATHISGRSNL